MIRPLLPLLLLSTTAHANPFETSVEALLRGATRVEIVRVLAASPADGGAARKLALPVEVVESLRGRAVGERYDLDYLVGPAPAPASELLVVCTKVVCPYAVGVDRGGWFAPRACQPVSVEAAGRRLADDACFSIRVAPGFVERASLRRFVDGAAPPEACFDVAVRFVDEPAAAPARCRLRVDARDGRGKATGRALGDAVDPGARVEVTPSGIVRASLFRVGGDLVLVGRAGKRAASGCVDVDALPIAPLARTPRRLARAVAGDRAPVPIARGTLRIDKTIDPLARGAWPAALLVDADGAVRLSAPGVSLQPLASPVAADGADFARRLPSTDTAYRPSVPLAAGRAALALDLSALLPLELDSLAAALATHFAAHAEARWPVLLDERGRSTPVGELELAREPDPK